MITSRSGEAWEMLYREGNITWADIAHLDRADIEQLAHGEIVAALRHYTPLLQHPPRANGNIKIVEAGCGLGLYSLALAALGFNVTAFDYSPRAIEIATSLRDRLGFSSEQVRFSTGNLLSIDLPDNTFDVVFNQAVLEYFTDDRELDTVLREMVRIAKPDGDVTVIVQNTTQLTLPVKRLLGHPGFTNQPPVRKTSTADFTRRLTALGTKSIKADGIDPWKGLLHGIPALTRTRFLHTLTYLTYRATTKIPIPAKMRVRLATQFVVSARKPVYNDATPTNLNAPE